MMKLSLTSAFLVALASSAMAQGRSLDPTLDAALAKPVTVIADRESVKGILEVIGRTIKVRLTAETDVKEDLMYVFANRTSAASVLEAIARLHRWQWQRFKVEDGWEYRLHKPNDVAKEEIAAQERWRKGREALAKGRAMILADLMQQAIDLSGLSPEQREEKLLREPWLGKDFFDNGGDRLTQVLGSLCPEERSAIAEGCLEGPGTVSATSQSFMLRNMLASQSMGDFSPDQREGLVQAAREAGAKGDLAGASVGLYAANGSIGLAIHDGDDVWLTDSHLRAPDSPELYDGTKRAVSAIQRGEEVTVPDGNQPEYAQILARKYSLELDAPQFEDLRLPRSWAVRNLKYANLSDRANIGTFLTLIHRQTGIPIVADGLTRSSRTILSLFSNPSGVCSLRDACAELCVAFRRKIREDKGWLNISSRRYAIYRLYEPPWDRVSVWLDRRTKQGLLSFDDLSEMAGLLSEEQVESLRDVPPKERGLQQEMAILTRQRPLFNLWNTLTPTDKRLALNGLIAVNGLSADQRRNFWRSTTRASCSWMMEYRIETWCPTHLKKPRGPPSPPSAYQGTMPHE